MYFPIFFASIFTLIYAKDATVLMTEVFAISLDPPMFNWSYEGNKDQFVYQASLLNLPDLPSWINYVFSERHHKGFLYGVPPKRPNTVVPLEIVALNKKNFETKVENLNIVIMEKRSPARFEVHLQINDVNVEDMFDEQRMKALKDIFQKQLWRDSEEDLYVTFLGSAVDLGARKPANPNEGEGVVIRLGSESVFSEELIKLQKEIIPIQKSPSCHHKKTTMERFFKDFAFSLDWCYFKLVDNSNSPLHRSETNQHFSLNDEQNYSERDIWKPVAKSEIPQRSYIKELLVSLLIPTFILVILALLLSFLLCFHHDDIGTYVEEIPSVPISQQETIRRATESLRNFSSNREIKMSPDLRSHTDSPNSTLGHGMHCRPSPPPYVRPKFKSEL